jgi:hypothetical protein
MTKSLQRQLLMRCEDKLTSLGFVHLGPVSHGWTTMEPSSCALCWIGTTLKEIREALDIEEREHEMQLRASS